MNKKMTNQPKVEEYMNNMFVEPLLLAMHINVMLCKQYNVLSVIITKKYLLLEIQPPYGGLLSSSCGGLEPSAASEGPKGDFARRTNGLTD